ncbi:MAG: RT0821/Lpp0805 family surface protein [Rickettsiales bacterium]
MKKFLIKATASLSILAVLAGCNGNGLTNDAGNVNKQNVGTLLGAGAGAWIGSNVGKGKGNIVGIAAGTLLGALAGSTIGKSLDQADVAYANRTHQDALEYNKVGSASSWKNPDSGASGTITPTKTYTKNERQCREYTQTISVGGKVEKGYGTACRQPDGSWEIIK